MRLSINGRVVKSWDVEVSTPRMVENHEGFQQLGSCLAVLTVGEEIDATEKPDLPNWRESSETKEQTNQILEDAKVKAAQIISDAEAEAQKMLAQAEAHVQELLEQAQAGLEHMQQEVRESTRAEIYPIAKEEGYQEGRKAGEAEGKRLTESANQFFLLAQRAVQEEYAKVDRELLHLAVKIAERIVRSTLAVEPQRLVAIIQSLTLMPLEREGWRLHVSPDDARWLEGNLPCPWVVDESLNSGDCFLECQEGIFDGRLEAQLDKLEHTLREELEHGGVESVS
ncbi:FliH/SctL family protein [Desulfosporosinus hippei]|uniref:Flagellar assembly protein FliH n=1 Tax=Desulfosporosinus hippei DSM 8344 TaxID=1121419 RepID=A0A1G7S0N0_9FIRM|nr:FliH/SctL family protein [Desulfosporosinus hippei]SDG16504.1 flagellar assembly protein FliH [Desulfosporosinus hippei DSM 8344]